MKEFIISEAQTEKAVLVGLITPEQNEQKVKQFVQAYQSDEVYNAAAELFNGGVVKGW